MADACLVESHRSQLALRRPLKERMRVLLVQLRLMVAQHLETALWQACSCLGLWDGSQLVESGRPKLGSCEGASQVE